MKTPSRFVSAFIPAATLAMTLAWALAIAPASAETRTADSRCSSTTWPNVSAVQCTKPLATNYVQCTEMLRKTGSRPSDAWWWCSSQGFKN